MNHNYLLSILTYNKNTGIFLWKVNRRGINIGQIAGNINNYGYRSIIIDGKPYKAHRLAWFYVYGHFPENNIDHINRNKADNRIANLREVSQVCNQRNTSNFSHNTSSIKGVHFDKLNKKWAVQIKVNKNNKFIDRFKSLIEAACHRLAAEQCLNWHGCDNNSPAFKYVKEYLCKH